MEGNAFVQIPVLDSNGHQQPPNEQDVGVLKVLEADLVGKDSESRRTLGSPTGPLGFPGAVTDIHTNRGWSLGSWNQMELVFGLPSI